MSGMSRVSPVSVASRAGPGTVAGSDTAGAQSETSEACALIDARDALNIFVGEFEGQVAPPN
jgi:hypothetical protein